MLPVLPWQHCPRLALGTARPSLAVDGVCASARAGNVAAATCTINRAGRACTVPSWIAYWGRTRRSRCVVGGGDLVVAGRSGGNPAQAVSAGLP